MRQRGSTSVVVLSLLLFVSALFLGAGMFLELSTQGLGRAAQQDQDRQLLVGAAESVVQALLSDATPFADSPTDPVWSWLARQRSDGLRVRLEDASSSLGLNWVRKEVVADMGVLRPGRTAEDLQQFREDTGIHLDLKPAFSSLINEDDLDALFTAYSYFNINITDEFVLRKLYFVRTGDLQASETFHMLIQTARTQRRSFEPESLTASMGAENARVLFPIVNAEPVMNIHFAPARALKALFVHYGLPKERSDTVVAARAGAELTQADLQQLIGAQAYEQTPLRFYLGLRTWFWRISVEDGRRRLVWIVARLPRLDGKPEFRLVEEQLSP